MAIDTLLKRQRSSSRTRMTWNSGFGNSNEASVIGMTVRNKILINQSPMHKNKRRRLKTRQSTSPKSNLKVKTTASAGTITASPKSQKPASSFLTKTLSTAPPASTPAPSFGTLLPAFKAATAVSQPKAVSTTHVEKEPSPMAEDKNPSPVRAASPEVEKEPSPMAEDRDPSPAKMESLEVEKEPSPMAEDKEPSPKMASLDVEKEPSPMAEDKEPSPAKMAFPEIEKEPSSMAEDKMASLEVEKEPSPMAEDKKPSLEKPASPVAPTPVKEASPVKVMPVDAQSPEPSMQAVETASPSPCKVPPEPACSPVEKAIAEVAEPEDVSFEVDSASPASRAASRSPSSEFVAWWDESDAKIEMRRSMIRMSTHSRKSVTFRSPLTIVRESVSPSPSPSPVKMSSSPVAVSTRLSFSSSASSPESIKMTTIPLKPPSNPSVAKKTRSVSKSASRSRSRSKSASPTPENRPMTRAEVAKFKVVELKEILKGLGLSPYGLKAELVTRVLEAGYCGDKQAPATPKAAPKKKAKTPSKTPKKTPSKAKTMSPIELNNLVVEAHKEGSLTSVKPSLLKQWLANNDVEANTRDAITLVAMVGEVLA